LNIFKRLDRAFNTVNIPEEHAAMLRGEQIEAFKKALPFGVLATAVNASIVIGYSALHQPAFGLLIWSAIIVLAIAFGVPAAIKAHKSRKLAHPRPKSHMRKPLQSATAFGLVWAAGAVLLLPNSAITEQMLITTVTAGMMCGGAYIFSTVPRAATSFVSTIGAGFGIAVILSDFGVGKWGIIMLLASYTLVMIKAAYWNYANYVRAWTQQIELNTQKAELGQQNEVINLLLKDFEQTASDCLWEINAEAELMRLNEDLAERINVDAGTTMPHSFADLLIKGGAEEHHVLHIFSEAGREGFFRDMLLKLKLETGDRWLSFSGKRKDNGGYRGVVADVTDAQEAEAQIRYLAHYDSLTKLANREQLRIEMEAAVNAAQGSDKGFALLCLDLDRFKIINDAHGHQIGDAVLLASAQRMQACLEDSDIAARVGGDEFTILQRAGADHAAAKALAESLIKALEEPIRIDDLVLQVSASIGVALWPENAADGATLLKNADLALYRAKKDGRARFCFFEQEMDIEVGERRELEADLRTAVRQGQFKIFFQPLVDGITRKAVGFEALLRWQHPTKGLVSPEAFIGIAEQTGMISTIGEWVIREALNEAACWEDGQSVSVNLSPLQVKSPTLLPTVLNALASSGVAAERLEFEITESVLLDDSDNSLKVLRELHDMGIRISLDDFGTGYSSLSYLSSFPFDKIKIDKSFVQSIGDSTECRAIVRAVAGLAGSLGMRSTAEGLETEEQIDSVMAEGCSELQGFYFSQPQSAETLEKAGLLRRKVKPSQTSSAPSTLVNQGGSEGVQTETDISDDQKRSG